MSTIGSLPSAPFEAVVVIADFLDVSMPDSQSHLRRDLEKTPEYVLGEVLAALRLQGFKVHHYEEPSALAAAASLHKNDIILSVYGGQFSRNRMALVPAICETFGLRFIGPDVYGRIVCQDKEISKRLAIEAGLTTPSYLIIRDEIDLENLRSFAVPFVVKPLLEGSSIGIGPDSLIGAVNAGINVARRLLREFDAPIIAETFVPGIEVNFSLIELNDRTEFRLTENFVAEAPDYFEAHLFIAQEKMAKDSRIRSRALPENILSDADRDALLRLSKLVGGMGYGRIDGKLHDGRFHFLEITPDAWLGTAGSFATGFLQSGWSYEEIIRAILFSRRG